MDPLKVGGQFPNGDASSPVEHGPEDLLNNNNSVRLILAFDFHNDNNQNDPLDYVVPDFDA